ncbi:MAG: lspA [Rhodoglobus sp.]|nr:lspA [Rhodoglobus sp.]
MPETDQQPTAGKPGVRARALVILAVVAVVVYTLDRVSKFLVTENLTVGVPVPVLGELLQFRYVENPGAAFSLGSGTTWIFAIIASAVAVFIVIFARRIRSVGWAVLFGLLLGGNLGNLTDRLTREPGFGLGHVVDFLQLYAFPAIFNLADVAIVSSMGLFIILTLRGVGLDGKRGPRDPKKPGDTNTAVEPAVPDPS